jgi:hypothetical protein
MNFQLRLLIWIPALTYEGFLLSGARITSLGQVATFGFLGASLGFLLASMLTISQRRREKCRLSR